MRADANDHLSQAQIESLLQHEERKSERYANYARLLFTVLYFAVVADDSLYRAKAEGRNRVIVNECCGVSA